mgnify:CR=1 FL=1
MLNKYDLVRLHRIAYSLGKRFYSSEDKEDRKFFKGMFENQENLLLSQFDYRWYHTISDWFPSHADLKENRILESDHSVTVNCIIILKEHKTPILCKMNIKPDDTITVYDSTNLTYKLTNIVGYYILPRYIQEN